MKRARFIPLLVVVLLTACAQQAAVLAPSATYLTGGYVAQRAVGRVTGRAS